MTKKYNEIENKLKALKIAGEISRDFENEFFTIYEVLFDPDITLNKIRARVADLSVFFGTNVEIEPADGTIYLKIFKNERGAVNIGGFTQDIAGGIAAGELPLIIGQAENGTRLYYDLTECPHLLVAGSTGSGKSVFMHNCIVSAIFAAANILLIDVKRVEFAIYENIPHLAAPISYDARAAYRLLKDLNCEMSRRYELLKNNHCRNIKEYREKGGHLNYLVLFIDELADLILHDRRIETELVKIAQLGRAAGIHCILATQRPDAQILSGLIRINVPSRVCFAVQKAADSRIILDQKGGEMLRGAGDGLFLPIGSKNAIRFQSPYISTAALDDFIEKARHVND